MIRKGKIIGEFGRKIWNRFFFLLPLQREIRREAPSEEFAPRSNSRLHTLLTISTKY